jgi:hypothetical protein
MTIAVAWVRRIADCEELVFASDSRLSGDTRIFDAAPKILTLPRGDCAIAFAGITQDAFPMMLQLSLAISSYGPTRRRSLELGALKTHALKIFDGMSELIKSDAFVKGNPPGEIPASEFLFGGYSWTKKRFEIWKINYNMAERRFVAARAPWARISSKTGICRISRAAKSPQDVTLGQIAFAGDQAPNAEIKLSRELTNRLQIGEQVTKLDMEPFCVLVEMLRDRHRSHTIGGAPQLAKIYQYMTAVSFPLYWPSKAAGSVYLQGRPCLEYEHLDVKAVDPDAACMKGLKQAERIGDECVAEA